MLHMATNFATITNSPVRCAFSGSDKFLPSAPCYSFHLHDYGCLLFHVTKPYRHANFSDWHFPYYMSQNYVKENQYFRWNISAPIWWVDHVWFSIPWSIPRNAMTRPLYGTIIIECVGHSSYWFSHNSCLAPKVDPQPLGIGSMVKRGMKKPCPIDMLCTVGGFKITQKSILQIPWNPA